MLCVTKTVEQTGTALIIQNSKSFFFFQISAIAIGIKNFVTCKKRIRVVRIKAIMTN